MRGGKKVRLRSRNSERQKTIIKKRCSTVGEHYAEARVLTANDRRSQGRENRETTLNEVREQRETATPYLRKVGDNRATDKLRVDKF